MIKYKAFLRWWLLFCLVLVGSVVLQSVNGFSYIFGRDSTKITAITVLIYYVMSSWCGIKTWMLDRATSAGKLTKPYYDRMERLEEVGWFSSEMCLNLGLLGTIGGFLMMLQGFHTLDTSNPNSVQNLLVQLGSSMGVALWTTCVGLVCSQLLKIQYLNFSLELQKNVPLEVEA